MRDNAYAIVQFAEKMEDLQSGAGEKALKGIVDYLKEHYNISEQDKTEEIQPPIYGIGQVVEVTLHHNQPLTISSRVHNGFTWMYSFEETDLRCGEIYLQVIKFDTAKM